MPYEFRFYIDHELHFQSRLESERCNGVKKNGETCKRTCCIGTPYCWTHLLYAKHIRIKDSILIRAGKGLFAIDPSTREPVRVFEKGDKIIEYDGELIPHAELERRYGGYTAPYGVEVNKTRDLYEDGAIHRGAGTLANHATGARVNARLSVSRNHVVLIATKTIKNGSEIYLNYGRAYRFNEPTEYTTKAVK